MPLDQINDGLSSLTTNVTKATVVITGLENAYEAVKRSLDIGHIRNLEKGYADLTRNLTATSKEVEALRSTVERLSKASEYYSTQQLAGMVTKLREGTSSLALFRSEHDKLVEKFTGAYRQGAEQYLQTLTRLSDQMPLFQLRVAKGAQDLGTLNEAFKIAGREGVSAYLKAIQSASDATDRSSENINDKISKMSKVWEEFKLKIGGGITSSFAANPLGTVANLGMAGSAMKGMSAGISSQIAPWLYGNAASITNPQYFPANYDPYRNSGMLTRLAGRGRDYVGAYGGRALKAGLGAGVAYMGSELDDSSGSLQSSAGVAMEAGGAAYAGYQLGGVHGAAAGATLGSAYSLYNFFKRTTSENGSIFGRRYGDEDPRSAAYQAKIKKLQEQRNLEAVQGEFDSQKDQMLSSFKGNINSPEANLHEAGVYNQLRSQRQAEVNRLMEASKSRTLTSEERNKMGVYLGDISQANTLEQGSIAGGVSRAGSIYESVLTGRQLRGFQNTGGASGLPDTLRSGGSVADQLRILQASYNATPESNVEAREALNRQMAVLQIQGRASELTAPQDIVKTGIGRQIGQLQAQKATALQSGNYDEVNKINGALQKQYELSAKQDQISSEILSKEGFEAQAIEANTDKLRAQAQARSEILEVAQRVYQQDLQTVSVQNQLRGLSTRGQGVTNAGLGIESEIGIHQARLNSGNATAQEQFELPLKIKALQGQLGLNKVQVAMRPGQVGIENLQQYSSLGGGVSTQLELDRQRVALLQKELDMQPNMEKFERQRVQNEVNFLNTKIQVLDKYDVEQTKIKSRLSILQSMGLGVQAAKEMSNMKGSIQEQIASIRGDKSIPEGQKAQMILDKQLELVNIYNMQRRTVGEQFAASQINAVGGSNINPGGVSGYAMLGSGYQTGYSFNGQRAKGTYQTQMEAALGPGISERSPAEQFLAALIGAGALEDGALNVRVKDADNNQQVNNPLAGVNP